MHVFDLAKAVNYPAQLVFHADMNRADVSIEPAAHELGGASLVSPLFWAGVFTIVWVVSGLFAIGRIIYQLGELRSLRRTLLPCSDHRIHRIGSALLTQFGIRKPVLFRSSRVNVTPFSFGFVKPIVVIPGSSRYSMQDLELILRHELVHIRRSDFPVHLLERIVRSVFLFHPLVHWLVRRIDLARESTCDVDVLSDNSVGVWQYASLLLSVAHPSDSGTLTISMGQSDSNLKWRISKMKDHLGGSAGLTRIRAIGLLLSGLVLALVVGLIACSDPGMITGSAVDISDPEKTVPANEDTDIYGVVEQMPQLIGGLESVQSQVRYPETAKRAGIEGTVFVQFVVNEEGEVSDAVVVRGIGAGCDEEALRAVQQARFTPGYQGGEPVKVRFSLPIRYRLSG